MPKRKPLEFEVQTTRKAFINGKEVEIIDFQERVGCMGIMVAPHSYFGSTDGGKTWSPMTGVTTILGVIAKDALIPWAANMAVDYVKRNLGPNGEVTAEVLEEARSAHRKKKEEAGTAGTDVHAVIEMLVKQAIQITEGKFDETFERRDIPQVQKFIEWAIENNIKFLASEQKVYNFQEWYAGTFDLLIEKDGKKYIADVKTSSGIYGREFFAQMAGYEVAIAGLNFKEFFGRIVIRLGKDGSFEVAESLDFDTDTTLFLSALKIYRAQETYKIKK